MGHAHNIIQKMAEFKCLVCGFPIGLNEAGTQVHLSCVGRQKEQEMLRQIQRGLEK